MPSASCDLRSFVKGPKINVYDKSLYANLDHLPEEHKGIYPDYPFFRRAWGLYGKPWQREELAYIQMSASLLHVHDMPSNMRCFIPKHFEDVILRYFYYNPGPGGCSENHKIAPVDWKLVTLNKTNYIYSEAHHDFSKAEFPPTGEETHISCYYFTPIDECFFIRYLFNFSGYLPAELSLAAMHQLKNEIVSTVQFELSDSQKKLQQETLTNNPTLTASDTRKPENWIYKEFEYDNNDIGQETGRQRKILVTPASPPPPYRNE